MKKQLLYTVENYVIVLASCIVAWFEQVAIMQQKNSRNLTRGCVIKKMLWNKQTKKSSSFLAEGKYICKDFLLTSTEWNIILVTSRLEIIRQLMRQNSTLNISKEILRMSQIILKAFCLKEFWNWIPNWWIIDTSKNNGFWGYSNVSLLAYKHCASEDRNI